eukprot:Skav211337  [mRNA]  locus=scaffold3120:267094:267957:+ [translate_table: standard]
MAASQWIEMKPNGPIPRERFKHSAVSMAGSMFVFGGRGGVTAGVRNDLWSYDPKANEWIEIKPNGPTAPARQGHSAVCIGDKMFVFGGFFGFRSILSPFSHSLGNDLWSFDPKANHWIEIKPEGYIPNRRESHSAVCRGDSMLVFGGTAFKGFAQPEVRNDLWSYDPKANQWIEIKPEGPIPERRCLHSAVCSEGKMFIFGGSDDADRWRNDLWAFDLAANQWIEIKPNGPIPGVRAGHSAVSIGDCMFVFGGYDGSVRRNDLWAYALKENQWIEIKPNGGPPIRKR